MRRVGEVTENHLDESRCPNRWVLRSCEAFEVEIGFDSTKDTDLATVGWHIQVCAWDGSWTDPIAMTPATTKEAGLWRSSMQLPVGYYLYRFCLEREGGEIVPLDWSRFVAVSDLIPRTLNELCDFHAGPSTSRHTPIEAGDHIIYSIIVDRFAKSESSAPRSRDRLFLNPRSPFCRHGGDLEGLKKRLAYIKRLGATILLLNPIYLNENLLYHGYHPMHLGMVDPLIGDAAELRELVEAAHRIGLLVMVDVVCNHIGDAIDWPEAVQEPQFKFYSNSPNPLPDFGPPLVQTARSPFSTRTLLPYPIEGRRVANFHPAGSDDPIEGRLFGLLDDWRTEDQSVADLLIEHVKHLISAFDFDGVRYDAVRHVEPAFWKRCVAEVDLHARRLGKAGFIQTGEHASRDREAAGPWRASGFTGLLDFPLHQDLTNAIADRQLLAFATAYLGGSIVSAEGDVFFLDCQDTTRIRRLVKSTAGIRKVNRDHGICLALLVLGPLTPMIYYGTEQDFEGALGQYEDPETGLWTGHDCYVREDMFANPECAWDFGPLNHPLYPPYSEEHLRFRMIAWLCHLRQKHRLSDTTRHLREESGAQVIYIPSDAGCLMLLLNPSHRRLNVDAEVLRQEIEPTVGRALRVHAAHDLATMERQSCSCVELGPGDMTVLDFAWA